MREVTVAIDVESVVIVHLRLIINNVHVEEFTGGWHHAAYPGGPRRLPILRENLVDTHKAHKVVYLTIESQLGLEAECKVVRELGRRAEGDKKTELFFKIGDVLCERVVHLC